MAEVALDIEFALRIWHAGNTVSAKKAHKVLHKMRADLTVPGLTPDAPQGFSQESVDMTEDLTFNWRGYVSNRKSEEQLREMVGAGITRFELRFLKMARDTNMKQARCDFVAHRVDNTCVRFHPSASADTVPVIGRLADWCGEVLPTELMERVLVGRNTQPDVHNSYYHRVAQSDVVGKKEAQAFLDDAYRQWQEGPCHRPFTRDLSSQDEFRWTLYLSSTDWGRALYKAEDIDRWFLVLLRFLCDAAAFYARTDAAFYARTRHGQAWVIRPSRTPAYSEDQVMYIQWN